MNSYVALAQRTIEEYVKTGRIIELPADLPLELLQQRAGVFVSIHSKRGLKRIGEQTRINTDNEGELRGCIGTFLPTKENIAQEIIDNAIAACSRDYRFSPISKEELPDLDISVDVLGKPELLTSQPINYLTAQLISHFDPQKYGVIVKSEDGRTGLLLPDIPGVDSPEQQISICRQKAGILSDEPIDIYRFEVTRHKE